MQAYHGGHSGFSLHNGQCFVAEPARALAYCGSLRRNAAIASVDIDLDALTVEECDGYNHDEDETPSDCPEYRARFAARGVDVLVYDDEDERGQTFRCYRLISDAAIEAVTVEAIHAGEEAIEDFEWDYC